MNIIREPSETAVKELLASVELPTADITPNHMEHFFGAWVAAGSSLDGVVGMEPFGSVALLRSFAVVTSKRCSGLGSELLLQLEQYAKEKGIRSMYLLTTTAKSYFEKHGYCVIAREVAPEAIRNTTEFTSVCPTTTVPRKYQNKLYC